MTDFGWSLPPGCENTPFDEMLPPCCEECEEEGNNPDCMLTCEKYKKFMKESEAADEAMHDDSYEAGYTYLAYVGKEPE